MPKDTQDSERQLRELEQRIEADIAEAKRGMRDEIAQLESSFKTFKDVMQKLREENRQLRNDRDVLLGKHKELLQKLPSMQDVGKMLAPVRQKIKENAALVAAAVKEDVQDAPEATPIDQLFDYVVKNGRVRTTDAAKKFNVHEARIEEWANVLAEHGLIELHYPALGKPELRKVRQAMA